MLLLRISFYSILKFIIIIDFMGTVQIKAVWLWHWSAAASKPTSARARVSLVSWEGVSHALLFMVPLGPPSARPMAQALRQPFE